MPPRWRWYPGVWTEGRVQLLAILQRTEVQYTAARARVTRNAVYNWTSGRRRPDSTARRLLKQSYGIPVPRGMSRGGAAGRMAGRLG